MPRSTPPSSSGSPSITNTSRAVSPPPDVSSGVNDQTQPPLCWPREIGGRDGPEPTRFGDWEKGGRCVDF